MHISQQRQKETNKIGMEKPGAPNRGGSDTARELALNNISDSRRNFEFKGKVVRNFRQNCMVPENVQYEFSVNEAISGIFPCGLPYT